MSSLPLFNGTGNNQFGPYSTGMPQTPVFTSITNTAAPSPQNTPANGVPPGVVPPTPPYAAPPGGQELGGVNHPTPTNPAGLLGGIIDQPGTGANTESTLYPAYTQEFYNWLAGQIGTGTTPFNLQTLLPSSGQATGAGQVNAPLTSLLSQLQNFYSTGQGGPTGASGLAQTAATGNPTDVGPAWDAMVKAQQQNIGQNEAQIREQFASLGNLKGSPFGTALTNYGEQTSLDQNSLLAQMQQQASEAATGRQFSAQQQLVGGANTLGTTLQGVDQSAIQNLIQQFQTSQPQNNPLNSILYGTANTFPPFFTSGSSGILAGLIPSLTGAAAGGAGAAASGGGLSSILLGALAGL